MVYILSAFLGIPLLLLVHAYIVFPLLMMYTGKKTHENKGSPPDVQVAILLAVYNEEKVIKQKLESTLNTTFPLANLTILVASDASTDGTDDILAQYESQYPHIQYKRFHERSGKAKIINQLANETSADILVMTDADTFFFPETLNNLLEPFRDPEVGGVQANLINKVDDEEQVAFQEISYNKRELKIKQGEGTKGSVIGAGGYCYAIRQALYTPVPNGFYVDDFFVFMRVLQQGFKTSFADQAYCTMEVSGSSEVQFQRKVRISKGNFQNLAYFRDLSNPFAGFVGFAFFSHKVIRWIGPFLLLMMLIANSLLLPYHPLFQVTIALQLGFFALGLLDFLFREFNWNVVPMRFISHFLLMNLALMAGFFEYLFNPADGTWEVKPS